MDTLFTDAAAISSTWRDELDMVDLVREQWLDDGGEVDVVALGKAAPEMAHALDAQARGRVTRRLVVAESAPNATDHSIIVGDHPLPGDASAHAGRALLAFLAGPTTATSTVFLISGGASSLCVAPAPPLSVADLATLWRHANERGVDISVLNQLRAATSLVGGGAMLRYVATARSTSLVLVDNVVSGPSLVASGFTYELEIDEAKVRELLEEVGLTGSPLGERCVQASARRAELMSARASEHVNVVLAEPSMMLAHARREAEQRGYRVLDQGAAIVGPVEEVAVAWAALLARAVASCERVCVLGVGEVSVRVEGDGRGGRCQEFVWRLAARLESLAAPWCVLARASDGRDHEAGVGGAWLDGAALARARSLDLDVADVARRHDTYYALAQLGRLLEGGHTGWNLCDLYVGLVNPDGSGTFSRASGSSPAST